MRRYGVLTASTILLTAFTLTCSCSVNDDPVGPVENPLPSEVDGKYVVEFNLNYDGSGKADTILVEKGRIMQLADKRLPERDGYRAGWYTSKECKPEQEWLFGAKSGGLYPPVVLDSMAVNQSIRLYAKWSSPVSIKTAEQFDNIRKDLTFSSSCPKRPRKR